MLLGKKKWYPYLNNNDDKSLYNNENIKDTSLIVCNALKYRYFTVFNTVESLYDFINRVDDNQRCFFEIIRGDQQQKPHFDIDLKGHSLSYGLQLLEDMADAIVAETINVLRDDIVVYTSNDDDVTVKQSYHVIIKNRYHDNHNEARMFYNKIVDRLPQYKDYIDCMVYSSTQQFRLLGSKKYNTNRTKRIMDGSDMTLDSFRTSLVSDVTNCEKLLCHTAGGSEKTRCSSSDDITEKQCDRIMKHINKKVYEFDRIRGSYILLKRIRPSFCIVCNKVHEHENPYVYILKDVAYMNCRRNIDNKSVKVCELPAVDGSKKSVLSDTLRAAGYRVFNKYTW